MPSMADMSMMQHGAAHASHASDASDTFDTPDDSANKHAQISHGDACGYCSLLTHLPAMPSVETLFVVAVKARQHTLATRFESVRRVDPLTFAQPRAPPFAS